MIAAAEKNNTEVVDLLLKCKKIDVNRESSINHVTPLIAAINQNNVDVIRLLLQHPEIDVNKFVILNDIFAYKILKKNLLFIQFQLNFFFLMEFWFQILCFFYK